MAARRKVGKFAGEAAEGLMRPLKKVIKKGEDLAPVTRGAPTPHVHARPGGLHSRSGALSNREVLEQDVGLPRTQATVDHYTRLAEVDFRGKPVEIIDSPDDIGYLDFQGAVARTDDMGVQLGPAAFQDEETLVRTLGHESVHVKQYEDGRVSSMTGPLEDEAYAAEDGFVETWRRNTR